MYVEYDRLPAKARVWVYQADRDLTAEEQEQARQWLEGFLAEWKAHGTPLKSGFRFAHDRFLLIAVDEGAHLPSGCSIDGSARAVREIGSRLGVDFLDRSQVPYLDEEGRVATADFRRLKELVAQGAIAPQTKTFNPQVKNKAQVETDWVQPAAESWLKKYF